MKAFKSIALFLGLILALQFVTFSGVNAQEADQVEPFPEDLTAEQAMLQDQLAKNATAPVTTEKAADKALPADDLPTDDLPTTTEEDKPAEETTTDETNGDAPSEDAAVENPEDEEVPEDLDSLDYDSFEKKEILLEQDKLKKAMPVSSISLTVLGA